MKIIERHLLEKCRSFFGIRAFSGMILSAALLYLQ